LHNITKLVEWSPTPIPKLADGPKVGRHQLISFFFLGGKVTFFILVGNSAIIIGKSRGEELGAAALVGAELGDSLGAPSPVGDALGMELGEVLGDVLGDVDGVVLGDELGDVLGDRLGWNQ
jgi:hypothetical protein